MQKNTVYFQFEDADSMVHAFGMLCQTGHHAHPALRVEAGPSDLVSALEIAQACGGAQFDPSDAMEEADAYTSAYGLEGITIPAHVVAEDWPDDYLAGETIEESRPVH